MLVIIFKCIPTSSKLECILHCKPGGKVFKILMKNVFPDLNKISETLTNLFCKKQNHSTGLLTVLLNEKM